MKRKPRGREHQHQHHEHAHGHVHEDDHVHDHDHDHETGHGHGHGHGEDHAHPHAHAHGVAPLGPELKRGAGQGKVVFFDAPSGLAGDMIISALVDLGVPGRVVTEAIEGLPLRGFHVHFGTRVRSGIVATAFHVHLDAKQPERTYSQIARMIEKAPLAPGVRARALATFRRLAEAEARVHRMPIDDVHFHEVGAIDAIVDVVGSAALLDYLGAELVVSPLPMGSGRVKARHGILPLPAPAVVECLRGVPTYDGGLAFEFVTPTGAAIVGAHASRSATWPSLVPERTGWGAGTADLPDRPNLLRAVLGTSNDGAAAGTHVVLEANVDDATGELLGHTIDVLLAEGALDAWAVPLTMKKGRPAFQLAALAPLARADALAAAVLRESTTLGVRRYAVSRVERPRRVEEVRTRFGVIPVKIAEGPFGAPQRKPEFDACRRAASAHGVSVREVIDAALVASAPKAPSTARTPSAPKAAEIPPKRADAAASPRPRPARSGARKKRS